jgi:carbonic anhydrase
MKIQEIFANNEKWIQNKLNKDENFFKNLGKGQQPEILYIGCSDSRVSAEELMGLGPGEVFVHRNIANLVLNLDFSSASVINFAVKHLEVKDIIICGHYECGGVKAAMQSKDLGILNPWLRGIRDVYRLHQKELDNIVKESERYDRLIELNVLEQCFNVTKHDVVQLAMKTRNLRVHGWVFDVKTGKLKELEFDYKKSLAEITRLYDLSPE